MTDEHYERALREAGPRKPPGPPKDLSPEWLGFFEIPWEGLVAQKIQHWADFKKISWASLEALGTRYRMAPKKGKVRSGGIQLAWAYQGPGDYVSGIKIRDLDLEDSKKKSVPGSRYVRPKLIGTVGSGLWLVAEGETDGARLWDLAGHYATIAIIGAGALSFKLSGTADILPDGVSIVSCLDNDEAGEVGSKPILELPRSSRLRPPSPFNDWCEWPGARDDFMAMLRLVT